MLSWLIILISFIPLQHGVVFPSKYILLEIEHGHRMSLMITLSTDIMKETLYMLSTFAALW